ncbi:hypothetical protein OKW76_05635 [Sphingomonas sp. S1-29]|uniref:hypothetical protein n=1 Tax=Sphingomonas sp. S1-29 TaxID=2991074 RepID=UPI00223EF741|nr:hypothetical protein [Sphingomonas sp. S1-29]UZK70524.1 hypothetical protein OKW76_05635 [Sphingomonas sp. S1-29]
MPPPAPVPDEAAIRAAHAAVRADSEIQFDFPWRRIEPDPESPWLTALGEALQRFFVGLGPVWEVIFWGMLAVLAAILVISLFPPARAWVLERLRRRPAPVAEEGWRPEAGAARALLAEAEALAGAARYDEAVRLLLHRSIEDIERWRGGVVRPSLTSRDIAAVDALPGNARAVFARIVALVERGLFARRPLGAADWQRARDDYAAFAL